MSHNALSSHLHLITHYNCWSNLINAINLETYISYIYTSNYLSNELIKEIIVTIIAVA